MNKIRARFYLIIGHVQGVGFRPFVYRLAAENHIHGWVENRTGQVAVHAEGSTDRLRVFEDALIEQAPPHASPILSESRNAECGHHQSFAIRTSDARHSHDIRIVPDLPVCQHCLAELFDKHNRRYQYPFINCTHCGPRYTLIRQLPYDRANTTMAGFPLCPQCRKEYENPFDRRFHAEPIACADCGPGLSYKDGQIEIADTAKALAACVLALQQGKIVAVKGIGGYHLMCDARDDDAVWRLRQRKRRPHKPLAVMLSETQLDRYVSVSVEQREFLNSAVQPILLVAQHRRSDLSTHIAPGLDEIGIMLPYSPLHHLLIRAFDGPLVATSANISGEPVLTDNHEVEQRLHAVADASLHHDRPIQRPADDPVYRTIHNRPRPLRLGRGNAPLERALPFRMPVPTLAVGGHMKNTIALAWDERLVISPHIGELGSLRSQQVFQQVIDDLQTLYRVDAQRVVCDAHPGYASHQWARQCGLTMTPVFHHHAHAAAVAGEFAHEARWLVFTWDGTGLGADQTLWGGEALLGHSGHWQRVASLRPFFLPGGEQAGRAPWRSAAAVCWEAGLPWSLADQDTELAHQAWQRKLNCPQSSAMGRLFDAAASLTGINHTSSFEGQGPMLLEAAASRGVADSVPLPLNRDEHGIWRTDWAPLVKRLMDDAVTPADRARCFHESMAHALLQQAITLRETQGDFAIGLGGGVFQNRLLSERVLELLEQHGFRGYLPQHIPVNDAGLCFGQVVEFNGWLQQRQQQQQEART